VCFSSFAGDGDSHRQQEGEEGREPFQIALSCGVSRGGAWKDAPPLFRARKPC